MLDGPSLEQQTPLTRRRLPPTLDDRSVEGVETRRLLKVCFIFSLSAAVKLR